MRKIVSKKIRNWVLLTLGMSVGFPVILSIIMMLIIGDFDELFTYILYVGGIMFVSMAVLFFLIGLTAIIPLNKSVKKAEEDSSLNLDDEYEDRERIDKTYFYTTKNFLIFEAFGAGRVYYRNDIESFSFDANFIRYFTSSIQRPLKVKLKSGKEVKLQNNSLALEPILNKLNDWLHGDDPNYQKYSEQTVETEDVKDENGNVLYTKVKENRNTSTSGIPDAVASTTDHKSAIILGAITVLVIAGLICLMWYIKGNNGSPSSPTTNNIGGSGSNSGSNSSVEESTYKTSDEFYDEVIEDLRKYVEYDNLETYIQYLKPASGSFNNFELTKRTRNDDLYVLCENNSNYIFSTYVDFNDDAGNNVDFAYFFMIRPQDYQSAKVDGTDTNGLKTDYYGYSFMEFDYEVPTFKYNVEYDYNDDYMWTNIITNNDNCNLDNVRSMAKRYYGLNVFTEYSNDGLYFYDTKTATKYEDGGYEYYEPTSSLYWADLNTDTKTITIYSMDNGTPTEVETVSMD